MHICKVSSLGSSPIQLSSNCVQIVPCSSSLSSDTDDNQQSAFLDHEPESGIKTMEVKSVFDAEMRMIAGAIAQLDMESSSSADSPEGSESKVTLKMTSQSDSEQENENESEPLFIDAAVALRQNSCETSNQCREEFVNYHSPDSSVIENPALNEPSLDSNRHASDEVIFDTESIASDSVSIVDSVSTVEVGDFCFSSSNKKLVFNLLST